MDALLPPVPGAWPLAGLLAWTVLGVPSGGAAEVLSVAQVRVFTINEAIIDRAGVDLALSVPAQMLIRPWFRWREARDYRKDSWVIAPFHERGISFGGGITMSALYRGENGLSDSIFQDYSTCDPWGRPYPAFGNPNSGYVHGALANRAYLDYALSWARQQIDAGVDNLFMDEVDGAYSIHEGFDIRALADFRAWLTRRYVVGWGWSPTDPRWTTRFRIDLADRAVCPDGTLASFDYRIYLQRHGWADHPDHEDNPLREEWGSPSDLHPERSYCAERRDQVWRYQADGLRAYARTLGRTVLIAANGLNRHVDFQIQGLWNDVLPLKDGRLDTAPSYAHLWRQALNRSRQLVGSDCPVVFFHDWGDGFPYWQRLDGDGRRIWLSLYAPEIYAAGGFFAFPVTGPFGCDARKDGSIATIRTLAAFFDRHADLYRNTRWLSERRLRFSQPHLSGIAKCQAEDRRLLLHVFNHHLAWASGLAPLSQVELGCPRLGEVRSVTLLAPELPSPLPLVPRIDQDRVTVTLPTLTAYAVLVFDHQTFDPGPMAADLAISASNEWLRPQQCLFEPGPDGLPEASDSPNGYVQGRLHPQLSNNPVFLVDYRAAGTFGLRLAQVADLGARLEILVDGTMALDTPLPGKGAPLANPVYAIPVTAGKHRIQVDNHGPDWFRVAEFLLTGYGR